MDKPWQVLNVSDSAREKIFAKISSQPEIFTFEDEPHLASLTTCLGLVHEIGKKDFDRLSERLGVTLTDEHNPWNCEIISQSGLIGFRMWLKSGENIEQLEKGFSEILDIQSFDEYGNLKQLIIFPEKIYQRFMDKGFELVIVRDWATSAFLYSQDEQVNYLLTNQWEVENNTARTQAHLMKHRRIAFSGTHDIADHLFNSDIAGFSLFQSIYDRTYEVYNRKFSPNEKVSNSDLLVSYSIGVLLDDLAQPAWYGSSNHKALLQYLLRSLEKGISSDRVPLSIPQSFQHLIFELRRDRNRPLNELTPYFERMMLDFGIPYFVQPTSAHKLSMVNPQQLID